jgi:hypothetical protein
MSDRFRVTVNGGVRIASNTTIHGAAMAVVNDPHGWKYVRCMRDPNIVAAIDPQRGVIAVTHAGTTVQPSEPTYPDWVTPLRRLLTVNLPIFKETPS